MNYGNRFRRLAAARTSISGPGAPITVTPDYTVPGDADTARISSVILWCSRFGVPLWRGAIAPGDNWISRPGEVTSPQIEDSNRRCSGPGQCDTAVIASVCPHPGDWRCGVKTAHPEAGQA